MRHPRGALSLLLLLLTAHRVQSAILEGQVVDPDGRPVPGTQVWAVDEKYEPLGTTVAGTDGRFVVDDLPEQFLYLYACQDGYALGVDGLPRPWIGPFQVVLRPGIYLSGRVRDPQGQPIAGAEVAASSVRTDPEYFGSGIAPTFIPCGNAATALSKKDGTFNLGPLVPGIWTLRAKAEGRIAVEKVPLQRSWNQSRLTGIEIVLKPEVRGTLIGRVLDPEGVPVVDAQIALFSDNRIRSQTGEDGSFQLRGIPVGNHRVSAEYPRYSTTERTLTINEGENRANLQFREKRTEIRGRVLDPDGRPVAGATVRVEGGSGYGGLTQEDGSFLAWLTPTHPVHLLSAWARGYFPDPQAPDVKVWRGKRDQYVEIRLYPATSVSGRIKGLSPEELTHVRVYGYYGERSDALGYPRNGRVDGQVEPDGHYRIDHLSSLTSEGIGIVVDTGAGGNTYRSVSAEVPVEPGQREAVVDLEFPPTYPVRGRVLDPDGEPLTGVYVSIGSRQHGDYRDYTREDGSFSVRVESGDYSTYLDRWGYASEKRSGPIVRGAPVENLEIRMIPGGEIHGQILGMKPKESVYVSADGPGRGSPVDVSLEGKYRISNLLPGEWNVTAKFDGRETQGRVSVLSGEKAFLDLDLRLGSLTLYGRLLDKPAEHLELELRNAEDPSFVYSRHGWDGTFSFERLREGTYQLQIKNQEKTEVLREQRVDLSANRELVIDLASTED